MIRRETTWATVEKGDYVLGKGEQAWKVVSQTGGMTYITNRAGSSMSIPTPDPARPVTKLTPTQDEAIEIVRKVLGGTVLHDGH